MLELTDDLLDKFWEQYELSKLATLNKKNFAFIGSMRHQLSIEPTLEVKDIYLNGIDKKMLINPLWFTNLSIEQSAGMIAHEVLHYALQHDIRRGNRLPQIYQKASDQVVNNMAMDFGFELPPDIIVNRNYQNQTLEQVYKQELLEFEQEQERDNQSQDNDNQSNQSGDDDLPHYQPPVDNNTQNQRNRELAQADGANQMSGGKSVGKGCNAFKQIFDEIQEGRISWQQLLAEHFNELTRGEPSYHDLDRRMLSLGLFEPIDESMNTCHRVALALDVSGSISEEQIRIFLQEIKHIANELNPEIISVMTFNEGLVDTLEFYQGDDLSKIPLNIGGGTSLKPVFDYYNKPENRPEFLIVFSDLWVDGFPKEPSYHTTWMCFDYPEAKVPFGTLIHVNTRDLK